MKLRDQQHHDGIKHIKSDTGALQKELKTYVKDQQQTFDSLQEKISDSLTENTEKVLEAEDHVTNLRELNVKLLDQVKEKMVAHATVQENTIETLRKDNDNMLTIFKEETFTNVNYLMAKSDKLIQENKIQLSSVLSEVSKLSMRVEDQGQNLKDDFESNEKMLQDAVEKVNLNSDNVDSLGRKMTNIENLLDTNEKNIEQTSELLKDNKETQQYGLDSISKQIGDVIDNFDNKSKDIDSLSESVLNLENRYSENVENMKQVSVLVSEYEVKTKEMGLVFKDDQRKEMKSIESQLNTIYTEYEKMETEMRDIKKDKLSNEKTLDEFLETFNKDVDIKFEEISKQTNDQTELMTKTDNKMSAILEQAGMLMVNNVKQDETISSIHKSIDNLNAKLADLESADTFLQESYRLVTERTVSLESQTKQFEDIHILLKSQKQEKIEENLEGKVNQLLTSVGEIVSEQDVISENITSVESQLESTGKRVEVL